MDFYSSYANISGHVYMTVLQPETKKSFWSVLAQRWVEMVVGDVQHDVSD